MHGIRHQDYTRYRQYCSKRTKSEKGLLFKIERAYFYSVQLLQESNEAYRKKQHSNKRLKKAYSMAEELTKAVAEDDVVGLLETKAYASFLKSHYLMQTHDYKSGLESFQQTKLIYEKLLLIALSAHHKTLIEQQLDEIEPCIRFCAYQLRDDFDLQELLEMKNDFMENDLISGKIQQLVSSSLQSMSEVVTWRDYEVLIRSPVLECMYTINNHLQHLESIEWKQLTTEGGNEVGLEHVLKAGPLFDKILGLYWDAHQIVEKEYKEDMVIEFNLGSKLESEVIQVGRNNEIAEIVARLHFF
jgi:signal recognition particle subunit SRP68